MVLMLPAAARVAVPWKNGGGRTTEIAVDPPGSGFDSFDWRVSMAEVVAAGPFSSFPGVDRELLVLDGCLRLAIAGRAALTLAADAEPVRFCGDDAAFGEPLAGAVTDLNAMARRGRCGAHLSRHRLPAPLELTLRSPTTVIVALSALRLAAAGTHLALEPLDAVRLEGVGRCGIAPRASAGTDGPDASGAAYCLVAVSRTA